MSCIMSDLWYSSLPMVDIMLSVSCGEGGRRGEGEGEGEGGERRREKRKK